MSQAWINALVTSQATQTAAIDAVSTAIAAVATTLAGNADPTVVTAAGTITTQLALLNAANTVLKSIGSSLPVASIGSVIGPNEVLGAQLRYH